MGKGTSRGYLEPSETPFTEQDKETAYEAILRKSLTTVLNHHYFKFCGQVYRQCAGPPMGVILSPLFCCIFMSIWEETMRSENNLYAAFSEFWKRYVDDVLGIWTGDRLSFQKFVEECSKIDPNIKFTSEEEHNNNGLICLDLRLKLIKSIKYPGRLELQFEHYRKDTASQQVIHYHSAHDPTTKANYITAYVRTICQNCNSLELAKPHIKMFEERLHLGQWPDADIKRLVQRGINRFKGLCDSNGIYNHRNQATRMLAAATAAQRKQEELKTSNTPSKVRHFVPSSVDKSYYNKTVAIFKQCELDFVSTSERTGNKLTHMFGCVDFKPFQCSDKNPGCKICKAPPHPKYRTPNNHDQTGCVYIITCMTCLKNKSTVEYIGETHRPLHVRFSEHNKKLTQAELNKVKKPKKNNKGQNIIDEHEPSAVSAHAMTEHNGNYNFSIGVLSVKRREDERKAYEVLAVSTIEPSMNKQLTNNNCIFPT